LTDTRRHGKADSCECGVGGSARRRIRSARWSPTWLPSSVPGSRRGGLRSLVRLAAVRHRCSFVRAASTPGGCGAGPLMYASAGPGGTVTRRHSSISPGCCWTDQGDRVRSMRSTSISTGRWPPSTTTTPRVCCWRWSEKIGRDVWLVGLDRSSRLHHRRKVANADIIVGHRTQPHDHPAHRRGDGRGCCSAWWTGS
jgi:hypothetical protein